MNTTSFRPVAVITGAGSGIGRSLALRLARRSHDLALCEINAIRLAEVAREARALGARVSEHVVDVADAAAVAALPAAVEAAHTRVSAVFNNAGVSAYGDFRQQPAADFEWVLGINFWGVVNMSRAFLPLLLREPSAHLVNVSSVFGFVGIPGQSAYCASKFAVRGFTEALRHELEATGVRVVQVHPGGIKTHIAHDMRHLESVDAAARKAMADGFVQSVRTTADEAADCILDGLDKGQVRIRIGADARFLDRLARLLPVRYWNVLKKRAQRGAAQQQAAAAP
ncbi:MAG: SDR family NAD(P)-dependent oxidoreductase [Rhizobacter sp.]|nr:SDR family NAD(P)-dependent oxidoreductase [Rhizobacter sp.]